MHVVLVQCRGSPSPRSALARSNLRSSVYHMPLLCVCAHACLVATPTVPARAWPFIRGRVLRRPATASNLPSSLGFFLLSGSITHVPCRGAPHSIHPITSAAGRTAHKGLSARVCVSGLTRSRATMFPMPDVAPHGCGRMVSCGPLPGAPRRAESSCAVARGRRRSNTACGVLRVPEQRMHPATYLF